MKNEVLQKSKGRYTELFEMNVGVIHNTLETGVYVFFLFNRTTLQVFVTYLTGVLYVLLNKIYIYCYLKCIVFDKLLKPRQSFRIILYILYEIKRRKANWIGQILPRNCLVNHVFGGTMDRRIEVRERSEGKTRKKTSVAIYDSLS